MANIAVFASGKGSNFDNIASHLKNNAENHVLLLVTDVNNAGCIKYAEKYKIPVLIVDYKTGKTNVEQIILENIEFYKINLITLAGFMRILSAHFIKTAGIPIINIHPSLLPDFKGRNSIERAYNSSCANTGITIHFVNEGIDEGEIITQRSIRIDRSKSLDELEAMIHQLEYEYYPQIIYELCSIINNLKITV